MVRLAGQKASVVSLSAPSCAVETAVILCLAFLRVLMQGLLLADLYHSGLDDVLVSPRDVAVLRMQEFPSHPLEIAM